jgi:hypothetical protein
LLSGGAKAVFIANQLKILIAISNKKSIADERIATDPLTSQTTNFIIANTTDIQAAIKGTFSNLSINIKQKII